MFLIYAFVEYQLFMGDGPTFNNECCAFLPRNVYTDLDKFIMDHYDRFYKQLAEVPGVARESAILIYANKSPIALENISENLISRSRHA